MKGWMLGVLALFLPFGVAAQIREVPRSQEEVLLSYAPVVKKVTPAVVNIYTQRKVAAPSPYAADPFFQQFFGGRFGGMPKERVVAALGSGVIVDAKGLAVTSNHVILGAEEVVAVLSDGREFPAEVTVTDSSSDLALLTLQTKGEALPYLTLANSDMLQVGDLVLAVGNPFGVGQTVTSGIVSALARSAAGVSDYNFFIQTDAAINPGNSGGALTDMTGRLIGINTAIYSKTGASNGIGFAIPSNMVEAMIRNRKGGSLIHPWLGAPYETVNAEIANAVGLASRKGALVGPIFPGGPAETAGIESGDVVTKLGDTMIESAEALKFRIAIARIGEPLPITLWRKGQEVTKTITFAAPPETPARDTRLLKGAHPLSGITVENLSPRLAADYGRAADEKGVIVSKSVAPFETGDRILSVNGMEAVSTAQLESGLFRRVRGWKILFERQGRVLSYTVSR